MVKLTGSLIPQGLAAFLSPLNRPCTFPLFTHRNRLLRTETQNQRGHLNSLESAGRGTKKVSYAVPGVKGRAAVLHCLDFMSPLASLLCRRMAATAFLSSTLLSLGIGSAFNASSMGNQAAYLPVFRSLVHPFFHVLPCFYKKKIPSPVCIAFFITIPYPPLLLAHYCSSAAS